MKEKKYCSEKHKNIQIEKKWKFSGKKFLKTFDKKDKIGTAPEKTIEFGISP